MDSQLADLALEAIARFDGIPVDRLGSLSATKVYDADRSIFLLRAENCSTSFALKVRTAQGVKEGDLADSATESEFRKIEAAFAILRTTSVAADMPVPVALFAEHRALLTTWCDGTELRHLFYSGAWRWPIGDEDMRAHFRRCGTWLGAFHDGSRTDADASETSRIRLCHVDRMLAQLSDNSGNKLSDSALDNIRSAIHDSLFARDRVDVGLLHGNFTLRNILCVSGRAIPVDFEDSRQDAIAMDVGQFVADIALSSYRPAIGATARKEVVKAFLDGYRERLPTSRERLTGTFLYHVLATYYEIVGRKESGLVGRLVSVRQLSVYSKMLSAPERVCANLLA